MIALRSGERMLPGRVILHQDLLLTYQTDGNFVLYDTDTVPATPVWHTNTQGNDPGFVEMQAEDGNLVVYRADGVPIWASMTYGPGAVLQINEFGISIDLLRPTTLWEVVVEDVLPPVVPPGQVRKLVGQVLPHGSSYRDDTGPIYVHGCTDFGGIVKHHENRDSSLRQLDVVAQHQQFIRVAWRLNGWLWTPSGLTIDPIRDGWWDSTLFNYLGACRDRGLRVNLTCADMFNWTDQQAINAIQVVAEIAANFGDTVILHEWNEMRGTCPGGESDVQKLMALTEQYRTRYGRNLRGISDPASQDKDGLTRLSRHPANTALVHNVRWYVADAIRRAFNIGYENRPNDRPVGEGEPTGPNGAHPGGLYGGHVWQPTENWDDLLGIYTMHILSGQISTYFNDPALVSRQPLDSTWGFKELPALWRQMEIPQDVGQGRLLHGGRADAPIQVISGNPNRADSVTCPSGEVFGIIFGRCRINRSGHLTAYRSGGIVGEWPDVRPGQTLDVGEPNHPTIVRIR